MSALAALLERIEEADRPDRRIDGEIMARFYRRGFRKIGIHDSAKGYVRSRVWVDPRTDHWVTSAKYGYEFTRSVDEALALVERVLPGVLWEIKSDPHRSGFRAGLWGTGTGIVSVDGKTAPFAILAALIRALIAKEES